MSLIDDIKNIQRAVGAKPDGKFGPDSAAKTLRTLQSFSGIEPKRLDTPSAIINADGSISELDARTVATIHTLDPKAKDRFIQFCCLAKATAATMGCDYVAISGQRSWDEQAELKRRSDAGGPHAAAPGYSWHNFAIAADFGVFQGRLYLDDGTPAQQALAERVHRACEVHAHACGLKWGGDWTGKSNDPPHYQIDLGHDIPTDADRDLFQKEGSVL